MGWQDRGLIQDNTPMRQNTPQDSGFNIGEFALNMLPGGSLINKGLKGEQITAGDVGLEAALSLIPFGLGKVAKGTKAFIGGTKAISRVGGSLKDKAATSLLKLTPSQTQKVLDAGVDTTKLAQRATQFGKRAEDIIGPTGSGGPLQDTIRSLELGIKTTAKSAGTNIKIDSSDIIKLLKSEAKNIKKELGSGPRLAQMNKVIADAEKKYAKGVTVEQALKTLRNANEKFGKSIIDDTGDAIVTAAQKLEANTLRKLLKDRFPSIKEGLDSQSELIQLREILKRARAVEKTGAFKTGKLDLTRPGSWIDPVLNSPTVSSKLLSTAKMGSVAAPGLASQIIKPLAQQAGVRLGADMLGRGQGNQSDMTDSTMSNMTPAMNNQNTAASMSQNMGQQYSNPFGVSSQQIGQALMQAYMAGDTQAASQLQNMYDLASQFEQSSQEQAPKLTSAQATRATAAQNALNDIPLIMDAIKTGKLGSKAMPFSGTDIGRKLLGTENLDAALFNIADNILRARSGAAAPEAEVKRFMDTYLPGPLDSDTAKKEKLARAMRELQGYMNPVSSVGDPLENALLQAQGGY